jgi:SOS response regulatory protein OraA/RecX
MDLSILQKVNDMTSEGRSAEEIKQTLLKEGIPPESITEALKETNSVSASDSSPRQQYSTVQHHEKIIQPSPGFDPNIK